MSSLLPSSPWLDLTVVAAFLVGCYVAAGVAFVRWRLGKKVVSKAFWTRLVDGYVALERSFRELNSTQDDSHAAYRAIADRLDLSTRENHALQQRLGALESHLNSVTSEATTLVTGLKDNEQRWVEAETIRTDLQAALEEAHRQIVQQSERNGSLTVANEELAGRLQTAGDKLAESMHLIEQLEAELSRRVSLEGHLHEALDRDRQQMSTLARLESRYRATHQKLLEANQRADRLQRLLGSDVHGESDGVFGQPIPPERTITIDVRDPSEEPPRTGLSRMRSRRRRSHRPYPTDRVDHSHGRLPE